MTEPEQEQTEPVSRPGFMRRVVAPAVAIMILYASIRALPSIIVSQAPPIDGSDLLRVFLISLLGFWLMSIYFDRQSRRKEPSDES